ncbi:hypothetical protein NP233_g1046 [Leucocoprinus birnbaumii]|uniref:Uncharacterized protein n=1 Tax=Leucocoprinus birnbaumii TaxID=56174 RepID=A0AAD5W185_9AGAR|nr:hypothetical protein NP233_g1046 [Leucocoprinus birnbaumii]
MDSLPPPIPASEISKGYTEITPSTYYYSMLWKPLLAARRRCRCEVCMGIRSLPSRLERKFIKRPQFICVPPPASSRLASLNTLTTATSLQQGKNPLVTGRPVIKIQDGLAFKVNDTSVTCLVCMEAIPIDSPADALVECEEHGRKSHFISPEYLHDEFTKTQYDGHVARRSSRLHHKHAQ